MKIFLLLALMSMSLLGHTQTTISVTIPQNIATKEWATAYIKYKIDSLLSHARPTVPPPAPPPTAPPTSSQPTYPCKEGPELRSVYDVSGDYLTFKFHGDEVAEIFWWITVKNNNSPVRNGLITPDSNTLKIDYARLPVGEYTLGVSGTKCIGSDTRAFSIK